MGIKSTYRFFNQKIQTQYREPAWGWGIRVGIAVTAPLVWGVITDRQAEAHWMAIAAECVSFIELKGNIGQRIRLLVSAAALSVLFCFAGSLAGGYVLISLLGMLLVGFISGLFKNLGDRGMGLALSVYIFYILTSAYPLKDWHALYERCTWVALGALWTIIASSFFFLFIKAGAPYRRTIAGIWKSLAILAETSGAGWDGRSTRSSVRDIYLKEKEVRAAIDASLYLFEETADQVKNRDNKYALTQSRKSASLVSSYMIQITERAEDLSQFKLERQLTIQLSSLFRILQQIGERMEVFLLTLKQEEKALVRSRLERLKKITGLLSQHAETHQSEIRELIDKIALLNTRVIKLVDHSIHLLEKAGEQRVFRAYSFAQTISILHPRYLKNNIKLMFNFNSFTTRYALRIGISTMAGAVIAYLFFKDHGYWIPFTTIIVSQPYFGATLKRGIERSAGTVAGIIAGFGFLSLPSPDFMRIALVFISSVLLIFYLKRKYSFAAFFITLLLVGLLGLEATNDFHLLSMRIIATLIGSALAIIAGFLLLPTWDKDSLPRFMAKSLMAGYDYFQNTFYYDKKLPWTQFKRAAETRNANAFDSLTRYMQEPGRKNKSDFDTHFLFLTHCVRIARELNNFNSEDELDEQKIPIKDKEKYIQLLYECDDLFRDNIKKMQASGNPFLDETYLKTYPEHGFRTTTPTDTQLVYIEKLLLELKFINTSLGNTQAYDA